MAIILGSLAYLSSCMTFRTADQKVQKYFQKADLDIQIHRQKYDGRDILKMVVLPKTGHFIPWSDHNLVVEELLSILGKEITSSALQD